MKSLLKRLFKKGNADAVVDIECNRIHCNSLSTGAIVFNNTISYSDQERRAMRKAQEEQQALLREQRLNQGHLTRYGKLSSNQVPRANQSQKL